MISLRS